MKILLLLGVTLTVGLVLANAQEPPTPTSKHPHKQCLDEWNTCAEETGDFGCLPKYYECLNVYTRKCRKLYRNQACYEILGKDECWKKLRVCYGHPSEE
ncbi:hypothetical protein OS493_013869 [Desmophyllum pertusum]|uniref:Uncharacterized protein n=1 Tax=Desmophyllum pertusum TaxID=174260 RepID=A0A9W9ZRJ5_9CNID|nr:hypothetical protein OS493_013869 [Desmophyllum pertusum]